MKKIGLLVSMFMLPVVLYSQESLSLEQCRSLALDHNQKIKIAKEQVNAAIAVKKSAFTQYLPDFSINGALHIF